MIIYSNLGIPRKKKPLREKIVSLGGVSMDVNHLRQIIFRTAARHIARQVIMKKYRTLELNWEQRWEAKRFDLS